MLTNEQLKIIGHRVKIISKSYKEREIIDGE